MNTFFFSQVDIQICSLCIAKFGSDSVVLTPESCAELILGKNMGLN